MTHEQGDELFLLRAACRDIVEALKDTKHLQKNMSKYIRSDNSYIRAEYNKIRIHLGTVLRQILQIQESQDDPVAMLSLDNIKLAMKEKDVTVNGMLEVLIREGRISAQMATSLMNDSSYVYDITKNLLQAGEVLFAIGDQSMKDVERGITLDENEIDEILHSATEAV